MDNVREEEPGETGRNTSDDDVEGEFVIVVLENVAGDFDETVAIVDNESEQGAEVDEGEEGVEVGVTIAEEGLDDFEMARRRDGDEFGEPLREAEND